MKKATLAALTIGIAAIAACDSTPSVSFKKDVHPILTKHCAECHLTQGEGTQKSGFITDSYESVMKGTKFGPVIVAGDAVSSTLYRLVAGKVDKSIQMPHGKEKLTEREIKVIQDWIDQGAENN